MGRTPLEAFTFNMVQWGRSDHYCTCNRKSKVYFKIDIFNTTHFRLAYAMAPPILSLIPTGNGWRNHPSWLSQQCNSPSSSKSKYSPLRPVLLWNLKHAPLNPKSSMTEISVRRRCWLYEGGITGSRAKRKFRHFTYQSPDFDRRIMFRRRLRSWLILLLN